MIKLFILNIYKSFTGTVSIKNRKNKRLIIVFTILPVEQYNTHKEKLNIRTPNPNQHVFANLCGKQRKISKK